jgi:hypothetical protein
VKGVLQGALLLFREANAGSTSMDLNGSYDQVVDCN